jgi:6-pyruvoyl-tetrahydropterin synthase
MFWVILDNSGNVVEQIRSTSNPADSSEGLPQYDCPSENVVQVERFGQLDIEYLDNGEWVLDLPKYKVKKRKELDNLRKRYISPNKDKQYAHLAKAAESTNILNYTEEEINNLSANDKEFKFPWLYAESIERNESIYQTATRVKTAVVNDQAEMIKVEATAIKIKTLISSASTKQEIDNLLNIDWDNL